MQGWPRAWLGRRTDKRLLQLRQCPVLTWPGSWTRWEAGSRVALDRGVQKGFMTPLCFQFIPESARYNISTGNVAAAMATLRRIAKMNGAVMPEGVLREPTKVSQARGVAQPLCPGQGCRPLGFGKGAGLPSTSRSASLPLLPWFLSKQLLNVMMKMSFFFWRHSNLGRQRGIEFSAFFFFWLSLCSLRKKYHAEKRFASFTTKTVPGKVRSSLLPIHPPGVSPVP